MNKYELNLVTLFLATILLSSCGNLPEDTLQTEQTIVNIPTVVDMPNTSVKKQAIGNCWIYSTVAWVESFILKESNGLQSENFSEAYLTYMHMKDQLLPNYEPVPKVINDAGNFATARLLIRRYGLIRESDFIPENGNLIEEQAFHDVNESLKNGPLKELYSYSLSKEEKKELVFGELNGIFGIDIDQKKQFVINAEDIIITSAKTGEKVNLDDELYNWENFPFKSVFEFGPDSEDVDLNERITMTDNQKLLLRRLMQTLNDGYPVNLSWFVDDHAHQKGKFSIDYLIEKGAPGKSQGGHISIIEDYTAQIGDQHLGLGELSEEEQALALDGMIESIVVKNSWGTDSDTSISVDGEYGYNQLYMDYLTTWIPVNNSKKAILPLISITLPRLY